MIVIGLTGSVGTGKTEACKFFIREKLPTFESDKQVKSIHEDATVQKKLFYKFPDAYEKKKLNKRKLSEIVFNDKQKLTTLESIIYEKLKKIQRKWIRKQGAFRKKIVVFDVPLLFEKDALSKYDIKILLTCSTFIQRLRVTRRSNWDLNRYNLTVKNQIEDKIKKKLADYIVYTDRGKKKTLQDLQSIMYKLKDMKPRPFNQILRNFH